ncbi:MAG: hypothetical protein R3E12_17675 [Candidatus Eisenbacteria bacterium]
MDSSIRGILVEDPRYGRIEATWDAFERLEFVDNKSSGRGYDSYAPAKRLRATVTDLDDEARTGTMYFDLDEGETWEFLNGTRRGVEYNIPFSMVRTIVPKGRDDSEVTLTNGETLRLEDGHDVSEENDGILLFVNDDEDDSVYIRWDDVDRIELLQ